MFGYLRRLCVHRCPCRRPFHFLSVDACLFHSGLPVWPGESSARNTAVQLSGVALKLKGCCCLSQASWSGVGMIAVKVVENVVHHALDTQLDKAPVLSTTLDHPNVVAICKVGTCGGLLLAARRGALDSKLRAGRCRAGCVLPGEGAGASRQAWRIQRWLATWIWRCGGMSRLLCVWRSRGRQ